MSFKNADIDVGTLMSNAFSKDHSADTTVNVKVDERIPPLFMLPPMYNGYTNYTCPIHEERHEEGGDIDEYTKKLNLGFMSARTRPTRKQQG